MGYVPPAGEMPELPEVETIVKGLKRMEGEKVKRVEIFDGRLKGIERLKEKVIYKIYRRGKYIIFNFNPSLSLIAHLGMTGKFSFKGEDSHIRASFKFDNKILYFVDTRRFGSLRVSREENPLPYLGLEPLSREFNARSLFEKIGKSRKRVKDFLMDQHKIAGIGNIYVNEILFRSRIHPERRVDTLSKEEVNILVRMTKDILKKAIRKGGTTIRDYKDPEGREGRFQDFLMVYGREGEPCKVCGSPIRRIKQGNRTTYFCEVCQKLERRDNVTG